MQRATAAPEAGRHRYDKRGDQSRSRRRDRALLSGAVATVGSRLVTAVASFISLGITARVVTPPEFGLVALVISFLLILTMFDLGVGAALITRVARSDARNDLHAMSRHVDHALVAMGVIGGCIATAGIVCTFAMPWAQWIGGGLPHSTVVWSLAITSVTSGLSLPACVGLGVLTGRQRFVASKGCLAACGILTVISTAAVAPLRPAPEIFVLTITGSPVIVMLVYTVGIRLGLPRRNASTSEEPDAGLASMLRASGWLALGVGASAVAAGTGTVIVGAVLGPAAAGSFGVASRLFSPILTVMSSAGALLWPGMTEAIATGDADWARSRYWRGVVVVVGVSSALGLVLIAIGPQLAELWVGSALVPSRALFAWTAAFTVSVALTSQAGMALMATERVRLIAILSVFAAVISVVASVVLTDAIGINGAPIGGIIGIAGILVPGTLLLSRRALRAL